MEAFGAIMAADASQKVSELARQLSDVGVNGNVPEYILDLVGKRCKIQFSNSLIGRMNLDVECEVLGIKEGWMKIKISSKKSDEIHLVRVSSIISVMVYD